GDVAQPHRIERVQRLLRAHRIPPAIGERGELVEFGLAEVGRLRSGHGGFLLWFSRERLQPLPHGPAWCAPYSDARSMAAMRSRHCFALAMIAPASMSTSPRSRSFGLPAIQTSLTWWRPVA